MRARVIEIDGTDPVAPSQPAPLKPRRSPVSVSTVRRWLREPLVHFLLIGLALFGAHRVWQQGPDAGTVSRRIERTEDGLGDPGLLGIAAAVFALVALAASLGVPLRAAWTRVVMRVAGSWIAAIGLLLLGWGLRPHA